MTIVRHLDQENARLRRHVAELKAELAKTREALRMETLRLGRDTPMDAAKRALCLHAIHVAETGDIESLRREVAAFEFARWSAWVDACMVCDAKSAPGSMWAWGIDEHSLCRRCAAEFQQGPHSADVRGPIVP